MRNKFRSRSDGFKIKKPVWACLLCGWFTLEGKVRQCKECHNEDLQHFDSQGEYYRYKELEMLQSSGYITDLERQVRYDFFAFKDLSQKPVRLFYYKADFRYKRNGEVVVEDYKPEVKKNRMDPKGERALDPMFKLKRRAMKEVYNIEILI